MALVHLEGSVEFVPSTTHEPNPPFWEAVDTIVGLAVGWKVGVAEGCDDATQVVWVVFEHTPLRT